MSKGKIITDAEEIKGILKEARTVAVLGLSPKPDRDSYRVADYLKKQGYRIIPVRPAQQEILGEKAYKNLDEIDGPIDIVDAFRNSAQIPSHVPEVLRLKPKVFWMQLGIENQEAAEQLTDAGINVVMNRCIKVEHGRIITKKVIV